jgi:hypothetical protein
MSFNGRKTKKKKKRKKGENERGSPVLGTAGEESAGIRLERVGGFPEREAGSGRPDLLERVGGFQ